MSRNKIILKKKNEKTFKKKCKSKKKRSFRNKKKLRGGNDPDTIDDLVSDVNREEDIQGKITLLGNFLDNKLISRRDTLGEKYRFFIQTPQGENYNYQKKEVIKLIQELQFDVKKVKEITETISKSLAEKNQNDDNKRKNDEVQKILEKSDKVLGELEAIFPKISVTPSNYTVNNPIEIITPITHTINPVE